MTLVASFADRDAAQRADAALMQIGIASNDVHLHEKGLKPHDADGVVFDEYATGGFFTNFAHLLDGLMNKPRKSLSYDELVQFEGMALSVHTDEAQAERVETQLRQSGAEKVQSGRGLDLD